MKGEIMTKILDALMVMAGLAFIIAAANLLAYEASKIAPYAL